MKNKIFIYPTDTVWGIGASIDDKESTLQIHKIKGSQASKPLSVLFSSYEQLCRYIDLSSLDQKKMKEIFKLESTLLFPKESFDQVIPSWIITGSDLVGIRCLEHPFYKKLTDLAGSPITTTSLNQTGMKTITDSDEAFDFYKKHCRSYNFEDDPEIIPSGASSTLCYIKADGVKIFRRGRQVDRILQLLDQLSFKTLF